MRGRRLLGCCSRGEVRLYLELRGFGWSEVSRERLVALDWVWSLCGDQACNDGPAVCEDGGSVGIEHESLILAQNERWRHA